MDFGIVLQNDPPARAVVDTMRDRKSTRLNSSHLVISYAVFCLKKKKHFDPLISFKLSTANRFHDAPGVSIHSDSTDPIVQTLHLPNDPFPHALAVHRTAQLAAA